MAAQKVLIVDDQVDFIVTVKFFLEQHGYKVLTAYNETGALEQANEVPDLILLDIMLPGASGFNILSKLRMNSATWGIPVIMLTSSADTKSILEAQRLRASDYIIKTESLDRMLAVIRKNISLSKAETMPAEDTGKARVSGIDVLHDLAWGAHVCAFYDTRDDLVGMLVPYIKAGLTQNEYCFWALSEGLRAEEAKTALRAHVSDVDRYIAKGQLKLVNGELLYGNTPTFNQEAVLAFWDSEGRRALEQGFIGMRVTGSGNWARGPKWHDLCQYEKRINRMIGNRKIIALCTYSLRACGMPEVVSLGAHHSVIVAKQTEKAVSFSPRGSEDIYQEYFKDADGALAVK